MRQWRWEPAHTSDGKPIARLVEAARAAVGQWRFEPVHDADGEPVSVRFKVTIRFKLD